MQTFTVFTVPFTKLQFPIGWSNLYLWLIEYVETSWGTTNSIYPMGPNLGCNMLLICIKSLSSHLLGHYIPQTVPKSSFFELVLLAPLFSYSTSCQWLFSINLVHPLLVESYVAGFPTNRSCCLLCPWLPIVCIPILWDLLGPLNWISNFTPSKRSAPLEVNIFNWVSNMRWDELDFGDHFVPLFHYLSPDFWAWGGGLSLNHHPVQIWWPFHVSWWTIMCYLVS